MSDSPNNQPEDRCSQSPNSKHFPDPSTFHLERDGDGTYLDVNCKWCGLSGCVGRFDKSEVQW